VNATITREDNGPLADANAVGEGLDAFNHAAAGDAGYAPLRLLVRDEGGAVAGGLLADVYLRWMFVKILWLDERLRGHGVGAELMRRAEAAAREAGCGGIWLDTFSFQAPEFYRKLGYEEFGRLDDYPPGFSRHFFRKLLA
jgi:GNAT superfamily N-acetyltransferase